MVTSQGAWSGRRGWLLRLEAADGRLGWGEAAELPGPDAGAGLRSGAGQAGAVDPEPGGVPEAIAALPARFTRTQLEQALPGLSLPLSCALGMALAELDGLGSAQQGGWRPAPPSAWLLPAGEAVLPALEELLAAQIAPPPHGGPFCVKWKVAAVADALERPLLEAVLERLPPQARLRLDANGGWNRATAAAWADRLQDEGRLEWLEQPLPPDDLDGLRGLAARLPLALDESLRQRPDLRRPGAWDGWQVRRPLLEGDPRPLLAALRAGTPRLMLSTAFETGIGRRLLAHLAALQTDGPTPAAPGLAPGWCPQGDLFAHDPVRVWAAAAP